MRFHRLDLNLLVALDALLTERSVSLAAERLCLSQSATSSALARLRDYFGDEMMVVRGRQMVLTARAEELIEPVRAVLDQIQKTIAVTPVFDPVTCDRQIRMMASDYVTDVLLSDVLRGLETSAPNMRVDILPMHDAPQEVIERQQVDLLVTLDYALSPDHPSQILFEDDHVVIGWDQNPAMHEEITRQRYFELGHVVARFGKSRVPAFEDSFMRRMKQTRRVEVVAPSFLSLGGLVIGTNRIATVHRRMAVNMASYAPLILRELPFMVPPIREAVQWHIANSNDAPLRWIVERTVAAAGRREAAADDKIVPLNRSKRLEPDEGHEINFHPVPHNG